VVSISEAGHSTLSVLRSLTHYNILIICNTLATLTTLTTAFTIQSLASRLGRELRCYRSHLVFSRLSLRMASTESQPSAKPMSEKQRLKLEKFAQKKEKQALQAQQKLQQPGSSSKEKKSKKQDVRVVESKDWIDETPAGQRKILKPLDDEFHKAYLPGVVESAWYSFWEDQGLFKPQTEKDGSVKPKGKYVIAMPPPNVWTPYVY
jgi:hypothetical protein